MISDELKAIHIAQLKWTRDLLSQCIEHDDYWDDGGDYLSAALDIASHLQQAFQDNDEEGYRRALLTLDIVERQEGDEEYDDYSNLNYACDGISPELDAWHLKHYDRTTKGN